MIKSRAKWHSLVQNGATLLCTQAGESTGIKCEQYYKEPIFVIFTSCSKNEIWYATNGSITKPYRLDSESMNIYYSQILYLLCYHESS